MVREILLKIILFILSLLLFSSGISSGQECKECEKSEIKEENGKIIMENEYSFCKLKNNNDLDVFSVKLKINLTGQVLMLNVPDEIIEVTEEKPVPPEKILYPKLDNKWLENNKFLSSSILSAKAKQFDDGLYGAVEIACQNGIGNINGKKTLLTNIYNELNKLKADRDVNKNRAFIYTASKLGSQVLQEDKTFSDMAKIMEYNFLSDPLKSKPIGFYTWNDELMNIFRQDRFLQTNLYFDKNNPMPLIKAIINSGEKENYIKYINFIEKLTNPIIKETTDLRPYLNNQKIPAKGVYAFLPPSRAYETELLKKLFPNGPVPDNFNLADTLIEEITSGRLDIKPGENSGWYDYQTYSLEPLILPEKCPEAKNLSYSENYKKELAGCFKSIISIMREIHIKQTEIHGLLGAITPFWFRLLEKKISISPELSAEPLITYYLRRAQSYNFIHRVLIDYFGKENLQKMHRLTGGLPVEENLDRELTDMEILFYGAASFSAMEIGYKMEMPGDYRTEIDKIKAMEFTKEWIKNMDKDPDVTEDNRMMVPVFYNALNNKTKVWMFLGYEEKCLQISYKKEPELSFYDLDGNEINKNMFTVEFKSNSKTIFYPVFAEIYVKNILNRDEFRKICDQYKTRSEIIKALQ